MSVVKHLDVFRWKDSHSAAAAPSPAQRIGAVQQVDDVTAQEVEMGGFRRSVVTQCVSQARFLHRDRDRR